MHQYILLLRGINVGGHRKIKMADLKALLQTLGYAEVQTYIQSGNIILQTEESTTEVAQKVKDAITKDYGFELPTMAISIEEWAEVIEAMPFKEVEEEKFLHLTYLAEKPEQEVFQNIKVPLKGEEAYQLIDKTIYLYCPNGYGRTKMTNDFWEKQLKVAATTRNWKTSKKLLEMGVK
jgi:uncharacterized protein (DUF1697 family)